MGKGEHLIVAFHAKVYAVCMVREMPLLGKLAEHYSLPQVHKASSSHAEHMPSTTAGWAASPVDILRSPFEQLGRLE